MEPTEQPPAIDRSDSAAPNKPMSRRRLLYLAGAGTAATVVAACTSDGSDSGGETAEGNNGGQTPDCVLTPEDAEGPFYTDIDLDRQDITDGKPGAPLELQLTVVDAATCEPISDAVVDVWHADAIGLYSAFPEQGDDQDVDTSAETFLRGVRTTDADGTATFNSVYPGWYPGRTTHVHLKVHLDDQTRVTSQLYFPDDVTAAVYLDHPAYEDRGEKDTSNDDDSLNGDDGALRMTVITNGDGYRATHIIGVDRA